MKCCEYCGDHEHTSKEHDEAEQYEFYLYAEGEAKTAEGGKE